MNEDAQPIAQPSNDVSFPSHPPKAKSPVLRLLIALIGVLVIVLSGAWFLLRGNGGDLAEASPTPYSGGLSGFDTATPEPLPSTPTPTNTPAPVDKEEIKIEILNGTGTAGEASALKRELEKLGYKDIVAGNADSQNETRTTFSYINAVSETVVSEITQKLEGLYTDVRAKKSTTLTGGKDIQIIIGPKKGASTSTTAPKATTTPKPSGSATPSPTPSPTATPN